MQSQNNKIKTKKKVLVYLFTQLYTLKFLTITFKNGLNSILFYFNVCKRHLFFLFVFSFNGWVSQIKIIMVYSFFIISYYLSNLFPILHIIVITIINMYLLLKLFLNVKYFLVLVGLHFFLSPLLRLKRLYFKLVLTNYDNKKHA